MLPAKDGQETSELVKSKNRVKLLHCSDMPNRHARETKKKKQRTIGAPAAAGIQYPFCCHKVF